MFKHVSNFSLYNLEVVFEIIFSEVKSPLQGFCGLSGSGEKPCDLNLKKCLLQTTQPRDSPYPGLELVS